MKIPYLILIAVMLNIALVAQPFTKKYIMSFQSCVENNNCQGSLAFKTYLAESNDGLQWTLVPNFTAYSGGVPDLIIRGTKLYIYNPGQVRRYNKANNTWDAASTPVTIKDAQGIAVQYVDPSAIVDEQGRIVLFYLNSTGLTNQDPAFCKTYPCDKIFSSAVEVVGSDGTQFVQQANDRVRVTLQSGTASDPDIFRDGSKFYIYVSMGNSVKVYSSTTLHGTYAALTGLPDNNTLTTQGGIPCGMYNPGTNQYTTYVHSPDAGKAVIKRAVHSNFVAQPTFTTIISAQSIGISALGTAESPGITENTFLTATEELAQSDFQIFPNPAQTEIVITAKSPIKETQIFDMLGRSILTANVSNIKISDLQKGLYLVKVKDNDGKIGVQKIFKN